MDMQQMINEMGKAMQLERALGRQFTLQQLIERLRELPEDMPILLGEAMSYRGYYVDLSFAPLEKPRTVKDALKEAENANGETFYGYKGGDFTMTRNTPVWLSHSGGTGPTIVGISDSGEILTAEEEENQDVYKINEIKKKVNQ